MRRTLTRTLLPIGAVLILAALVLPKLGSSDKKQANNPGAGNPRDQQLAVRTHVVQPERLGDRVLTVGTILPNEEVEIRSEISGKIDRIFFTESARVTKGEMLLKINDAELQARFLQAQSRRTLAEQEEARWRELLEKNLASPQEYDRALNELNVVKAEAQLIEAQLAKTEIRAPFDGVVGLRYVSEGGYVTPTTRITTLQDHHVAKIDFAIPERYAGAVKKGDAIQFTVEGSSQPFAGTVYALESKIDAATRTLRVRAQSPNPDRALLSGAFANVEVVLKEKDALMIPSQALIPELKGHKVFLYKGGKAIPQSVAIGARTDERVEITQGIEPGDTLITSAILQLRPGVSVRLAE
jgi:membrane fusion protein (multidrug efflux system)